MSLRSGGGFAEGYGDNHAAPVLIKYHRNLKKMNRDMFFL